MSEVLISLASRQVDTTGEVSRLSLTTAGKYYERAGCGYITYQESGLTGLEGATTLLKTDAGRLSVIRMGSVEAKQVFVAGQRHTSPYITPYGTLRTTVIPRTVEVALQDGTGRIRLEYDLEIDGQLVNRIDMVIDIKKA